MIGEYMFIHRIGYEKCDRLKKSVKLIYSHNCVHYVVSGQGFFNGERLCGGMGFVCRKGEAIEYYPDPSDPWEYYWISMDGEDSAEFLDVVNSDVNGLFFHTLEPKLKALYNLSNEMNHAEFLRRGALREIAFALHSTEEIQPVSISERYVQLAKEMIDDNLGEDIKIEDIARKLHLNRCYLRNIFFKFEGMSPSRYKQKRRMEQAAVLLRAKNYPISMVASSVGYDDPLCFSREFKKHYSVSPSEYRKLI